MIRLPCNRACRTALGISLLLAATGCSSRQSDEATLLAAISKAVGVAVPANATILAYHHEHDSKDVSQCSQLWVVQTAARVPGPNRRISQHRAESPSGSLKLLVEQATDGRVVIEPVDRAICECVEWRHGETMCRLRQIKARSGWVAVLEAVSPE